MVTAKASLAFHLVIFLTCTKTFPFLSIHLLIALASKRVNVDSNDHSYLKVNAKLQARYAVSWL